MTHEKLKEALMQGEEREAAKLFGTSEILVGGESDEQRSAGELSTRFRCENGI
jgi:hypothetical protein